LINDTAAKGFERGAAEYERARPSYPVGLLELLPPNGTIVDLAAGTGKLTRLLPGAVVAVEPVSAMRAVAATFASAVAGTAERIPLRDRCADAVTVAQAFHWFDIQVALAEVARVLKPGGTLLLVWNERDERVPWVVDMSRVIHARDPNAYLHDIDWPAAVEESGLFTPIETRILDNPQPGATRALVVERALSTSYIAAGPDEVREQVAQDVHAIVADFDEPFDFPYVTQIFTCRRTS
jgi:SAM-dependent methyltransferase